MKPAVIYARYSSENQREESISAQLFECKKYAQENDFIVVGIYTDEAFSATTDARPGFLQMFDDIGKKNFQYILIHKLDRVARDKYDSAIYKKKLKNHSIRLISITQPIEDSPEGGLLESVLESLAQYYSENLSREAMKGLNENARNCKHNGGIPPLGYRVTEEQKYEIIESEAIIVRTIFEMFSKSHGYNKIISELNRLGYKTKVGNTFSKNSISDILRNEKYVGIYTYNRRESKHNQKRNNHKYKDESLITKIPNGIPAIIENSLFEKVNEIIASRKHQKERSRLKAKKNYLLSGKITCGECGSAYVGNSFSKYSYYECNYKDRNGSCKSSRIKKEILEEIVLSQLQSRIFVNIPELVLKINELNEKKHLHYNDKLLATKNRIADTKTKIGNLLKAIESGTYSQTIMDRLTDNERIENELNSEFAKLLKEKEKANMTGEELQEMLEEAKEKLFLMQDEQETKNLIQKFVNQVIVYKDRIEVSLNTLC